MTLEMMRAAVRTYFRACNAADRDLFYRVLADDAVHYFPPGMRGPYVGKEAIADLWIGFVKTKDSRWTIDRMAADGNCVVIEWTHFWPVDRGYLRGSEWYEFDAQGKISAIWAHYASPRDPERRVLELEEFPYVERGYPVEAPDRVGLLAESVSDHG